MNKFKNYYSRESQIRAESVNDEERSIEGVLSTEEPVMVFDWYRFEPILEVLRMDGVELPKQLPLLNAHSRESIHNIVGSTRELRMSTDENGKPIIIAKNFISEAEQDIFTKAKEGHITDTSIGYVISEKDSEYVEKGETKTINGREYKNESKSRMVLRTKWTLKENSLVPIGADKMAKLRAELETETIEETSTVARSMKMNQFIHNHNKNLLK